MIRCFGARVGLDVPMRHGTARASRPAPCAPFLSAMRRCQLQGFVPHRMLENRHISRLVVARHTCRWPCRPAVQVGATVWYAPPLHPAFLRHPMEFLHVYLHGFSSQPGPGGVGHQRLRVPTYTQLNPAQGTPTLHLTPSPWPRGPATGNLLRAARLPSAS